MNNLRIWLSVDPMAENTPFATPYAYCINNPIILHDPDGQDWFVNEITGDIYFDEDLKKGSESFVADGKNIKWLGENDMFGQSASSAILGNQDIGTIWNSGIDEAVGRAEFKGKDAAEFADRMGFEKKVSSAIALITETTYSCPELEPGFRNESSEELFNKKYTYAKKGSYGTYTSTDKRLVSSKTGFGILDAYSKRVYSEQRNYTYSQKKPGFKMNQNTINFILKTSANIISIYLDSKKK